MSLPCSSLFRTRRPTSNAAGHRHGSSSELPSRTPTIRATTRVDAIRTTVAASKIFVAESGPAVQPAGLCGVTSVPGLLYFRRSRLRRHPGASAASRARRSCPIAALSSSGRLRYPGSGSVMCSISAPAASPSRMVAALGFSSPVMDRRTAMTEISDLSGHMVLRSVSVRATGLVSEALRGTPAEPSHHGVPEVNGGGFRGGFGRELGQAGLQHAERELPELQLAGVQGPPCKGLGHQGDTRGVDRRDELVPLPGCGPARCHGGAHPVAGCRRSRPPEGERTRYDSGIHGLERYRPKSAHGRG